MVLRSIFFILIFLLSFPSILQAQRVKNDTALSTGIETKRETTPSHYRVTWIKWDSDFRKSNLQIGDQIIGFNNVYYKEDEFSHENLGLGIGDYLESTYWERRQAQHGDVINLLVRREGKVLTISGKLLFNRFYFDENGKRSMDVNGPSRYDSSGFGESWPYWYEKFTKEASYILDDGWAYQSFNNRKRLKEYEGTKKRVEYLLEHHPGDFANSVLQDWTSVYKNLEGDLREVTAKDLEYRDLGVKRASVVKEQAQFALEKFTTETKEQIISAFPTIDAVNDDRSAVVGKVVELSKLNYRNMFNDLGSAFMAVGSRYEGYYFIDCESDAMQKFFQVFYRYKFMVDPKVRDEFTFFAVILDDPKMLSYRDQAVTGLSVEVIAVSAGDKALFVDLRNANDKEELSFAGEDLISQFPSLNLTETSSPAVVMEVMISSIKQGNREAWEDLFADWRIYPRMHSMPIYDSAYYVRDSVFTSAWEQSRKMIMGDVYDVRVSKVSPVTTVYAAQPDVEIPTIEEVTVIIEHIGLFSGEYRTFKDLRLHRIWKLQRRDDGPWKIVSLQNL